MKDFDPENLILFGIGNSSRGDDGLGWKFLDILDEKLKPISSYYRYQLQIEDAELITQYDTVVFVDSSKKNMPKGYSWYPVTPQPTVMFSTHILSPESILSLCKDLYSREPAGYVLGIQGYQWELGADLSPESLENLEKAVKFFEGLF